MNNNGVEMSKTMRKKRRKRKTQKRKRRNYNSNPDTHLIYAHNNNKVETLFWFLHFRVIVNLDPVVNLPMKNTYVANYLYSQQN